MFKTLLAMLVAAFALSLPAAAVNTYYVSPTGTGSACTISAPCTVASMNSLISLGAAGQCTSADGLSSEGGAGACVHALSGTYTGTQNTTKVGTSSARIVWVSDTKWGAKFVNANWDVGGSFTSFIGLDITSPGSPGYAYNIETTATNIHILGNNLHDFTTSACGSFGVITDGSQTAVSQNNWFIGNIIRHAGNYNAAGASNFCVTLHGIYSVGGGDIIENNVISGITGWGIKRNMRAAGAGPAVIANNTVFNNGGGMDFDETNDNGFQAAFDYNGVVNNIIYANGVDAPNGGRFGIDFFHVGLQAAPEAHHNFISNNLMYANKPNDLAYHDGVCQGATATATATVPAQGVQITNNDTTGLGGCPFDNGKTDASSSVTFVSFQTDTNSAPAASYNVLNYQIKQGSSGVGTGTTSCAASPGFNPCVPTTDIVGTVRTNAPSIGAFELTSSPTNSIETITPASPISFPSTPVGSCSVNTAITTTNTGTGSFTLSAQSITPTATDFQFGGSSSCNFQTLSNGQSCFDNVTFCPTTTGTRTATYTNTSNANSGSQTASLTGVGTSPSVPAVTVPPSVPFANQSVLSVSSGIPFTLLNSGTAPLSITSIAVADTINWTFNTTCGTSLGSGLSCTITPFFQPKSTGAKTTNIVITTNASSSPNNVGLSGTPTQAMLSSSAPGLTFSTTLVGTTTTPQTISITNNGNGPVILNIATSGSYTQTNTCSNGFSDTFSALNSNIWALDGGPAPGAIAGVNSGTFSPSNATFSSTGLQMEVTQTGTAPTVSVGAELRSLATYGYGTYTWVFRSASTSSTSSGVGSSISGQVSSGFLYINNSQSELDFSEVEGAVSRNTLAEFTTWDSLSFSQETSVAVTTPWNTFHAYKVVWAPGSATYFVDGVQVAQHTNNVPSTPAAIMANLWGTNNANFGGVSTPGTNRWMYFQSFSYVPMVPSIPAGGSCSVSVSFKPTQSGNSPGVLSITTPDGATGLGISLSGVGQSATNGAIISGGVKISGGVTVLQPNPQAPIIAATNIDDTLVTWPPIGWKAVCILPGCNPGGTGTPTATSRTINNPTPSLDGESMQISETGPASTNALWTYIAGIDDTATNLSLDVQVQLSANASVLGSFEVDQFNFSSSTGIEFMWGSQCNFVNHLWQVFDQLHLAWVNTSVACSLAPGSFHRIQETVHRINGDTNSCSGEPCMYYDTLVVDGVSNALNLVEPSGPLPGGFASAVGLQFQLDIGSGGSAGVPVFANIDSANFTAQ